MITIKDIEQSGGLALELEEKKKLISPRGATLLGSLTTSLLPVVSRIQVALKQNASDPKGSPEQNISIDDLIGLTGTYACSDSLSNGESQEPGQHDVTMDDAVKVLAERGAAEMKFAREEVNSRITQLEDQIRAQVSANERLQAENLFELDFFEIPDLLLSPWMEEEMEVVPPSPEMSGSDLLNMEPHLFEGLECSDLFCTVTDNDADLLITEFINQIGLEQAVRILISSNQEWGTSNEYLIPTHQQLIHCTVNYLFYRQLALTGNWKAGLTIRGVISKATISRDYYHHRLSFRLAQLLTDSKNGALIVHCPASISVIPSSVRGNTRYLITVEKNQWEVFSESAGIEVLLGFLCGESNKNGVSVNEILANKEEHLKTWNSVRGVFTSYRQKTLSQDIRIFAKSCVTEMVLEEWLSEHYKEVKIDPSKVIEDAACEIDQMCDVTVTDLNNFCIQIVAGILFGHTSAYRIISIMKSLLEVDEKMTVESAQHIALIYYLTDFFMYQCDVVSTA